MDEGSNEALDRTMASPVIVMTHAPDICVAEDVEIEAQKPTLPTSGAIRKPRHPIEPAAPSAAIFDKAAPKSN